MKERKPIIDLLGPGGMETPDETADDDETPTPATNGGTPKESLLQPGTVTAEGGGEGT